MKKKKEKIRYDGAQPLLVLPYVVVSSAALMYTICLDHVWVCTAIMSVFACAVYMLVYSFRSKPVKAAALTLCLTGLCFAAVLMTGSFYAENGFMDFLFTASSFFDPKFAAAAIVVFSVVVGFMCCYFSAIMPRMCYLMLVSFIPLILSSRTAGGLPLALQAVMFGTFVLAVLGSARACPPEGVAVHRDMKGEYIRSAAAVGLALVSVLAAFILPKSSKTPLGSYLDSVFLPGEGYYQGGERLSNFVSHSSVNKGDNSSSENLLFTVRTDAPMLIDRWVFDLYEGENGWHPHDDYNTGYDAWEHSSEMCRYAQLSNDLRTAAQNGLLADHAEYLQVLPEAAINSEHMFIRVTDGSATKVILHPVTVTEVQINRYNSGVYRTPKGELFTEQNIPSAEYLITYHAEEPPYNFAQAVSVLDYQQLLVDAVADGVMSSTASGAFLEEYNNARAYQRRTGYQGISMELGTLTEEITADCLTDLEKAFAIERWFGEQGFVYDLEFVPRRSDVDYFVFESKTGICSDYATAMTLMARAAGLPARYTEGFALDERMRDEYGTYNVTSANAHAYAQIYIAGCGWLNFDPTKYVQEAEPSSITPMQSIIIAAICVGAVALVLLAFIFRERLGWIVFSATYQMRSGNAVVKDMAVRMRRIAASLSEHKLASLSLGEAEQIITQRLSMPDEAAQIRSAADELLYSGNADGERDIKQLYRCLASIRRKNRRMKR